MSSSRCAIADRSSLVLLASFPGLQSQLTLVKLLRKMTSGGRMVDMVHGGGGHRMFGGVVNQRRQAGRQAGRLSRTGV